MVRRYVRREHPGEIIANETIGTINPNIYGHFTEHIGGVIYPLPVMA